MCVGLFCFVLVCSVLIGSETEQRVWAVCPLTPATLEPSLCSPRFPFSLPSLPCMLYLHPPSVHHGDFWASVLCMQCRARFLTHILTSCAFSDSDSLQGQGREPFPQEERGFWVVTVSFCVQGTGDSHEACGVGAGADTRGAERESDVARQGPVQDPSTLSADLILLLCFLYSCGLYSHKQTQALGILWGQPFPPPTPLQHYREIPILAVRPPIKE